MHSISILIIEPTEMKLEILEKQFNKALQSKIIISITNKSSLKEFIKNRVPSFDMVMIGELIDVSDTIQIAKTIRENGFYMPLILLTQLQDRNLSQSQKNAGIDDCLNVYEFESETFAWTLSSLLQKSALLQKAEEFDTIRKKIVALNSALKIITHEINNPLGVLRLALYQLDNKIKDDEALYKYSKMISENVDKIEIQIQELRKIRDELQIEQTILRKILSLKEKNDQ